MKLLITGATGVAGLEALRYALADPAISAITVLTRRSLPPSIPAEAYADPRTAPVYPLPPNGTTSNGYPPYTPTAAERSTLGTRKLTAIQHADFLTYPPALRAHLADHAGCVWAQGRSAVGVSEAEYVRLTHDYPVAALEALREAGVGRSGPFRFVYISGLSVDRTEKPRLRVARVKGRAEVSLLRIAQATVPPQQIVSLSLRPGYFFPSHPHDRLWMRGAGARAIDSFLLRPLFSTLAPASMIGAPELGKVAVEVAKGSVPKEEDQEREIWGNKEMVELVQTWKQEKGRDEL